MPILLVSLLAIVISGCSSSEWKRSPTKRVTASNGSEQSPQPRTTSDLAENFDDEEESDLDEAFAEHLQSQPKTNSDDNDDKIVLTWPIGSRRITGRFGEKRSRHRHTGIDISAPMGTPVFAPADGKIISTKPRRGYGKTIMLTHDADWDFVTIYGHLSRILVRVDEKVKRGQVIGLVGRTGRASGPHLHFEVRVYVKAVDPRQYLP